MRWHTFHGNAVQIKKTLCNDIVKNWHSLKALVDKSNFNVTVPLMYFEKELHVTKKKPSNLKQSRKMLIWNFWQHSLINCCRTVYHRNMLHHYRKTIKPLTDALNAVYMDIDFVENLFVPVKYKSQL